MARGGSTEVGEGFLPLRFRQALSETPTPPPPRQCGGSLVGYGHEAVDRNGTYWAALRPDPCRCCARNPQNTRNPKLSLGVRKGGGGSEERGGGEYPVSAVTLTGQAPKLLYRNGRKFC